MRLKIIAVNVAIVLVVGLLAFSLVRVQLMSAGSSPDALASDAKHDAQGAAARLQLDGLTTERWLLQKASEVATRDPLSKGTAGARGDAATKRTDELLSEAKQAGIFEKTVPTFAALVDMSGKIVGRNGSNLSRGDDLIASHPGLRATLTSGEPGSDIWTDRDRYLASYVVVRDEAGKIAGGLVTGRPINDLLSRVSDETTGRALALVQGGKGAQQVVGHSAASSETLERSIAGDAKPAIEAALTSAHSQAVKSGDVIIAVAPLESFGDGRHNAIVAVAPASLMSRAGEIFFGIVVAMAVGIALAIIAGLILGNYLTNPINELEEGLLAILNGQTEKRFELDHPELGGLAFRIDQLLNQLMGVEEDTTDAEGRPSVAPSKHHFSDALAVDDKRMSEAMEVVPESAARLANEPEEQYYTRLYQEYVAAKRALGEATEHITESAFRTRIRGMESEAEEKYGRPVRYQVQRRDREVVLIAVPLG